MKKVKAELDVIRDDNDGTYGFKLYEQRREGSTLTRGELIDSLNTCKNWDHAADLGFRAAYAREIRELDVRAVYIDDYGISVTHTLFPWRKSYRGFRPGLGDWVKIRAILVRQAQYTDRKLHNTFWKRVALSEETSALFLGLRTLSNGNVIYNWDEGSEYRPKEYFRAALVCPGERLNPVYVALEDVWREVLGHHLHRRNRRLKLDYLKKIPENWR